MDVGLDHPMVICECQSFLTWMQDVFLPWSVVSAGHAFLTWMLDVFLPWSYVSVGRAFLRSCLDQIEMMSHSLIMCLSDVSAVSIFDHVLIR